MYTKLCKNQETIKPVLKLLDHQTCLNTQLKKPITGNIHTNIKLFDKSTLQCPTVRQEQLEANEQMHRKKHNPGEMKVQPQRIKSGNCRIQDVWYDCENQESA